MMMEEQFMNRAGGDFFCGTRCAFSNTISYLLCLAETNHQQKRTSPLGSPDGEAEDEVFTYETQLAPQVCV